MTDPEPEQDDLTFDDNRVRQTDNGWHDGDGPQPEQIVDGVPVIGDPQ